MGILFRWFILTIAIWAATRIESGVHFDKLQDLLVASLVLGVLNVFVKPLLRLISLPFIILSFGFFLLVINGLLLVLTSKLVHGFHVDGFWPAVWASLVISLVSFLLGFSNRRRRPRPRIIINQPPPFDPPPSPQGPPPGKGPIIDV